MVKGYCSPEIKIYFFSSADVLTLSSNNEQFDNGTNDGTWEDFWNE